MPGSAGASPSQVQPIAIANNSLRDDAVASQPAGYSGTPLAKKLGIKENARVLVLNEPAGYRDWLAPIPAGVSLSDAADPPLAFVHLFVTSKAELAKHVKRFRKQLAPAGVLWVSWPKKASGVETDVTEGTIREVALPTGLVDVKVCAVSEVWAGLKLVIRISNR
jgi:hypothetical protein